MKQGDIYLVNFGKKYNSELGKIRPAVLMQNNFLNKMIAHQKYKNILVIPLTSDNIITEYKIPILARDNLKKDSFIITNWLCTVDIDNLLLDKGLIAKLTEDELQKVKQKVCDLM